jgi:hypothetical protein
LTESWAVAETGKIKAVNKNKKSFIRDSLVEVPPRVQKLAHERRLTWAVRSKLLRLGVFIESLDETTIF